MGRARREGGDFDYETRLLMPDQSVKYLRVVAHSVRNKDGEIELRGAVQDVTAGRLAEEALEKVRSELAHVTRVMSLGALTASIAHEVNQPLSGIITNASTCLRMLAADPPNVDGAQETARRTIRDGNRAADVIARLRALFTKRTATIEPVDLNEAVREVIALSSSDLQRSRVVLRTELGRRASACRRRPYPASAGDHEPAAQCRRCDERRRRPPEAAGDQDRTGRGRRHVRLSVQDAGVGFGPAGAERLFEAFYTTKSDGMGIGLSVSRSIIERHQRAPVGISRMMVRGPRSPFPSPSISAMRHRSRCRRHAGAGHQQCPECSGDFMKVTHPLVSVVDDDESVRESLPDLLREFGFSVEAFSSAEEFLASDSIGKTRCLILDVAMPGMTGPDLQRELARRGQSIPIVFITAHKDDTVRPRLHRTGRGGVPVQAVQRCRPAGGAELGAPTGLTIAPCYGHPRGIIAMHTDFGDCTWRQSEVGIHAARNACRVRRRRRHFRARIAGAADPLRRLAAGDVRVRAGIPRSPAGARPELPGPGRQSSGSQRARPAEARLRRAHRHADHLRHRLRRRADDGEGDEGRSRRVPDQAIQRRRAAGRHRAGARTKQGCARARTRRCGRCANVTHRSAVASRRSWRWWSPAC